MTSPDSVGISSETPHETRMRHLKEDYLAECGQAASSDRAKDLGRNIVGLTGITATVDILTNALPPTAQVYVGAMVAGLGILQAGKLGFADHTLRADRKAERAIMIANNTYNTVPDWAVSHIGEQPSPALIEPQIDVAAYTLNPGRAQQA